MKKIEFEKLVEKQNLEIEKYLGSGEIFKSPWLKIVWIKVNDDFSKIDTKYVDVHSVSEMVGDPSKFKVEFNVDKEEEVLTRIIDGKGECHDCEEGREYFNTISNHYHFLEGASFISHIYRDFDSLTCLDLDKAAGDKGFDSNYLVGFAWRDLSKKLGAFLRVGSIKKVAKNVYKAVLLDPSNYTTNLVLEKLGNDASEYKLIFDKTNSVVVKFIRL